MRPESPPSVPQPSASTGSSECRAIDLAAPTSHQPAPQADAVWSPSPDRRLKTGRLLRTALRSLAVLALASLTLHAWSERRAAERLTERLALGCFDVADCRALLLAAQARHSACLTSCGSEVEQVRQAREQFRAVLERAAAVEQAARDVAFQKAQRAEQERVEALATQARHAAAQAAEREHRQAIERAAAETQRLQAQHQLERQQSLSYLQQLSPEQRERRLSNCRERGLNCTNLVALLLEAAANPAERLALLAANEASVTLSHPVPPRAPPLSAKVAHEL